MNVADVVVAISVAISGVAFVSGVSAWRREYVGKRRIDLAESVLALFYEAEDAIREIRSPFASISEGTSRERRPHEREEESKFLDQAYVVFERYQKREQLFAQLRSSRYRFMAAFGSEAGRPFEEMERIIREIFAAAQILGTHYWPRQGRARMDDQKFQRHLDEMHKREAVFWITTPDEDEITPRVRAAVARVEEFAHSEIQSWSRISWNPLSWFGRTQDLKVRGSR